ncbi:MAG: CPBP family intramembrane metalloprotease [Bacteroidetes bacterium]|nr:CPBP family intramembrane metalloprotease [Bacteroidota bacterium]
MLQNIIFRAAKNAHRQFGSAHFYSALYIFSFSDFFRLLMGALLGYLYFYSGSLWSAILAHFVNNIATVIA